MYSGNRGNNQRTVRVGNWPIRPVYAYIGAAVLVLLALFLVLRFLNASLVMHFGAYAGVLLLIANLRELLGNSYGQKGSTALLNVLVGGALLFAWLSQLVGSLMWLPALILVGIATPLIFARARVYTAYIDTARTVAGSVRRTLIR
jgi:hypothetical protein